LVQLLAARLGRPVVDRTGIEGRYNFDLQFAPENAGVDTTAPSIFTALEEQCGLRLEKTMAEGETFVIERAERPSGN
jgi:uncharacterized protein (TIGR03435 family)